MATNNQLNYGWLGDLPNAHHDGTTQQIDDHVQAFETDNQVFNQKRAALHQARQTEDEVWLKSQRDAVVPLLEGADKRQDGYISGARYILTGHAGLPDGEPTQQEAKACLQVFKDFNFSTHDAYGAEADKIIQMQQNLQPHQAFMQQIGAWTFLTQAVSAAHEVRQYLSQRAQTKGEFVKGEMKAARRATDQAIADLYRTIEAMMELMPSAELSALYTQLKGIELYARQYYLNDTPASSGTGSGSLTPNPSPTGEGSGNQGGGNTGGGSSQGGGSSTGGDNGGNSGGIPGGGEGSEGGSSSGSSSQTYRLVIYKYGSGTMSVTDDGEQEIATNSQVAAGSGVNISVVPVAGKVPTATLNGDALTLTENDGTYTGSFQMPAKGSVVEINSDPSDLDI